MERTDDEKSKEVPKPEDDGGEDQKEDGVTEENLIGDEEEDAKSTVTTTPTTVDEDEEDYLYEGCGREGPILCIFIAEFHHIAGPKIVYQYPPDVIQKEVFDSVSTYIIPKTHLQRITMTVNVLGKKIIGYPIQIQNDKYERNAFYFNTCFVCDAWARTVQYEVVLVKLAEFFNTLEQEIEYLSKNPCGEPIEGGGGMGEELKEMFSSILVGINGPKRECSYVFQNRLLALKVVSAVLSDPVWVESHSVPVFLSDVGSMDKWDLTTQKVIPYVDGFNHVAQISHLADVHVNLVKTCLQNLLYYNLIKMIPAFQYSNMYCITPNFHSKLMLGDSDFRTECVNFVARSDHVRPSFPDVVRFYCALKRGVTVKEVCVRFRQIAASGVVRVLVLESKYCSSKYSDQSLSSSAQSRTSSNPTTPIKLHTTTTTIVQQHQSLSTRASLGKRHPTGEYQSILNVIDERKLILFGLLHELIKGIEKFPVFIRKDEEYFHHQQQVHHSLLPSYVSSSAYQFGGYSPITSSSTPSSQNQIYNNNNVPSPYIANLFSPGSHYLSSNNTVNGSAAVSGTENTDSSSAQLDKFRKKMSAVYSMFDGSHSFDKICLSHGLSQNELEEIIERDPDVVTIWK